MTKDNVRYFTTFVDDCSRYCYVYFVKNEDEALEKLIIFKNEAETQTDKVLKILRSNIGGEYTSTLFDEFCKINGIVLEITPPYTHESNGLAERKNRTFADIINNMLVNSWLHKYMWGESLNTAFHILNRVPMKYMKNTPYKLWKGKKKLFKLSLSVRVPTA